MLKIETCSNNKGKWERECYECVLCEIKGRVHKSKEEERMRVGRAQITKELRKRRRCTKPKLRAAKWSIGREREKFKKNCIEKITELMHTKETEMFQSFKLILLQQFHLEPSVWSLTRALVTHRALARARMFTEEHKRCSLRSFTCRIHLEFYLDAFTERTHTEMYSFAHPLQWFHKMYSIAFCISHPTCCAAAVIRISGHSLFQFARSAFDWMLCMCANCDNRFIPKTSASSIPFFEWIAVYFYCW